MMTARATTQIHAEVREPQKATAELVCIQCAVECAIAAAMNARIGACLSEERAYRRVSL